MHLESSLPIRRSVVPALRLDFFVAVISQRACEKSADAFAVVS